MSQIIEELINEVGVVRFSVLSENKIQLEYKVPIISQNVIIDEIKMKFRYKKKGDIWSLIPIKERFINKLSVKYGIKKKNIKYLYLEKELIKNNNFQWPLKTEFISTVNFKVDDQNYKISSLFKSFRFDDINWHRENLLRYLINN